MLHQIHAVRRRSARTSVSFRVPAAYVVIMRPLLLGALIAVLAPSVAAAHPPRVAPPGNSGVNQYLESVPTARGGRPSNTIQPPGGPTTPSGGGGASSGGGGGNVSVSTQHALVRQGRDGRAVIAVTRATAPATGRGDSRLHTRAKKPTGAGTSRAPSSYPRSSTHPLSSAAVSSPGSSVVNALTGSTASGGLGPILPVIAIAIAIGAGALALLRRRRSA